MGGGTDSINEYSSRYCFMRLKVYVFVDQPEKAIEWGIKCLSILIEDNKVEIAEVYSEIQAVGKSSKSLNEFSIRHLTSHLETWRAQSKRLQSHAHGEKAGMEAQINTIAAIVSAGVAVLNQFHESYGDICLSNQQYKEAIASFLMMDPPNAEKSVKAARSANDWKQTLILAQRFGDVLPPELRSNRIAADLVLSFKGELELSQSTDFDDFDMPLKDDDLLAAMKYDKAIEASSVSVDFCNDSETAIEILLLSRCWLAAVYLALKVNRKDLLHEDIATAARESGKTLLTGLKNRISRHKALVSSVEAIWKDPEARLKAVSQVDPLLGGELSEQAYEPEETDNRSEYSAVSQLSRSSNYSFRSGTSAVSILSDLVVSSTVSEMSDTTKFSIEGLDHTLLSRGTNVSKALPGKFRRKEAYTEKRERKQERKRGGKSGKDVAGLKAEADTCIELWRFAQIGAVSAYIQELSDALLVIGTQSDFVLIKSIQQAMDEYVEQIATNAPIAAPNYPLSWLQKRQMPVIQHFQENHNSKVQNWWQRVADGLSVWRSTRRSNLCL